MMPCPVYEPSLTYSFPWHYGTLISLPNILRGESGESKESDIYKVIGYTMNEHGTWVILLPVSFDGITSLWKMSNVQEKGTICPI